MKKQTPKAPARQIDLEEMIQEVQPRTRSGKLKRTEQLKLRVPGPFKSILKAYCKETGLSESDLVLLAVCRRLQNQVEHDEQRILNDIAGPIQRQLENF